MWDDSSFTLVGLAYRCQQETARFQRFEAYDARYCLALFKSALDNPADERSKRAWDLIHQQYLSQVMVWVRRHSLFRQTGREAAFLAELALEKMWVSFARSPDKFGRFPYKDADKGLKALLQFLKACIHSVIMDALESDEVSLEQVEIAEDELADPLSEQAFWHCVYQRLNNDKERIVIDAMFVYGLKPQHIAAMYSAHFNNVGEIYRIKENVLARLRRDSGLQDCLDGLD